MLCFVGQCNIPGYISFKSVRWESFGGGVSVFHKNNLDFRITEINNISLENIESVYIKLETPRSKKKKLIAVYRLPYHKIRNQFTSDIDDLLKKNSNLETISIGGDLNLNLLSPDDSEWAFAVVLFSSFSDQHIKIPTRMTENTAALIDHIWSNSVEKITSGVFDADTSAHHITFAFISFRILTKTFIQKFRDHSHPRYIKREFCTLLWYRALTNAIMS